MNNDDIMQAIEQVARQADNDRERMETEAFINKVAMDTAFSMTCNLSSAPLILTSAIRPQIETWVEQNRRRLSLQMEQVVRILLRRELLGE